ncbi:hypothetical protein [Pseudomonas sp. AB12(2023)]|uniref:hypothetical protein n=1 Tax=Pseudomonas sp. AB12(2023) TaxID=3048597 RepID=UPI002B225510|nr:hypothetical protein [Pseudomonas sp. AB12(2023)]MEB0221362.1 hypothetical protein [Pseudomonas sp. AB12(2023)]
MINAFMIRNRISKITIALRGLRAKKRKQDNRAYAAVGELFQKAASTDPVAAFWTARWLLEQTHTLPVTRSELAQKQLAPLLELSRAEDFKQAASSDVERAGDKQ